jgi:hypothetical protein
MKQVQDFWDYLAVVAPDQEEERFITAYPHTEDGRVLALGMGDQIADVIVRRELQDHVTVRVRLGRLGWEVTAVLSGKRGEPDDLQVAS